MPEIVLYGRTYFDAEIEVDLASLATGKGKVDVPVPLIHGGFAANAARAIRSRFPAGALRVVTALPAGNVPGLRADLPAGVGLEVLASKAPLPICVILNPARECRLLRDPAFRDAAAWKAGRISRAARSAPLQVFGRLPLPFVAELLRRAGGRTAWVGGHALPLRLEKSFDLACVNRAEAARLAGRDGSPRELAAILAGRGKPGAVRLVTGGGSAPAVAAYRGPGGLEFHESAPAPLARESITRLKGSGDLFAAVFLAAACFDRKGRERAVPDLPGALAAAQSACTAYLSSRRKGPR